MNDSLILRADISGPNADAVEAALREFLSEQFGTTAEPQRSVRRPAETERRGPEWMEWATFVLSVPGGLLAAIDLAARLKLKERAQRLLQRLRDAKRQDDGGVVVKIGDQPPIDLTGATAAEIVAAVEAAVEKQRQQ